MRLRLLLAAALAAALAACASAPAPRGLPPGARAAAEARQASREADLRRVEDWSMSGRLAVSVDGDGGSGRLEWRQDAEGFSAEISAPVTRRTWRLSGGAGWARLDGIEGGPREGVDAAELLYASTGWYLPVATLADWARGLRASGPVDETVYGEDGRLARLRQAGWRIDYEWPDAVDGAVGLPRRIDARLEDAAGQREARVRLVVDAWQVPGEGDPDA